MDIIPVSFCNAWVEVVTDEMIYYERLVAYRLFPDGRCEPLCVDCDTGLLHTPEIARVVYAESEPKPILSEKLTRLFRESANRRSTRH